MSCSSTLTLLVLADTHLGFDLPTRPRVQRVRRGEDFFASYASALAPARAGQVDAVIHLGDLLYRSRVPAWLVERAVAPLRELAAGGLPVVLVPGNHERSHLPFALLAAQRGLQVLDRPGTIALELRGHRLAVVGFPCCRDDVRQRFAALHAQARGTGTEAGIRLLCLHQCIEGMTVGPRNFMFTSADDVIRARELPHGYAAVLAGHVHRHQVLTRDRAGQPLAAPVLVPGSTERTSLAEADETKGALLVELAAGEAGGRLVGWTFVPIETRPLGVLQVPDALLGDDLALERWLRAELEALARNAVVQVRWTDCAEASRSLVLRAARLRALAGADQIIELSRPAPRALSSDDGGA